MTNAETKEEVRIDFEAQIVIDLDIIIGIIVFAVMAHRIVKCLEAIIHMLNSMNSNLYELYNEANIANQWERNK